MTSFLEDIKREYELYRKIVLKKRLNASEQKTFYQLKEIHGLDKEGCVSTQKRLAEILGVSTRTVTRWVSEGMPVESNGTYNPIGIIQWGEDLLDPDDEIQISEKSHWDTEFRKFRAKLAELELLKARSQVIDLAVVENLLVERAIELKKSLLSRAKRLSTVLAHRPADEIYQAIEDDALDTLNTYSRPSPIIEEAQEIAKCAPDIDA